MQHITPDTLAKPGGPYSAAVVVDTPSQLVFVAGQTGIDPVTGALVGDDIESQTERAFANLGLALDAAGATWQDVTKLTSFVVGEENLAGFRDARNRVFADAYGDGPYPAHTLLVVAGLARPGFLFEVEATAARPA